MSVITFKDIHGAEQTVDLSQEKFNLAFNADCMSFFRACPNNSFSWIVADPPYGDGSSQSVNVERERESRITDSAIRGEGSTGINKWNRFGQRFDRYKHPCSQNMVNPSNEPEEPGRRSTGKKS